MSLLPLTCLPPPYLNTCFPSSPFPPSISHRTTLLFSLPSSPLINLTLFLFFFYLPCHNSSTAFLFSSPALPILFPLPYLHFFFHVFSSIVSLFISPAITLTDWLFSSQSSLFSSPSPIYLPIFFHKSSLHLFLFLSPLPVLFPVLLFSSSALPILFSLPYLDVLLPCLLLS